MFRCHAANVFTTFNAEIAEPADTTFQPEGMSCRPSGLPAPSAFAMMSEMTYDISCVGDFLGLCAGERRCVEVKLRRKSLFRLGASSRDVTRLLSQKSRTRAA